MRIIGGKHAGIRIQAPRNLPVRPTTDLAKEALFNILVNRLDFDGITVLDLFSGTGGISLEFASRGAAQVIAVDASYPCVRFLKETAVKLRLDVINTIKADAFNFAKQETRQFDLVFADPPFDHPKLISLPELVAERGLLKNEDSLFIMEHPSALSFEQVTTFTEKRHYGYSSFSFFRPNRLSDD